MTKRIFLSAFMVYAASGQALPVNILQSSSLVQQVKEGLNESRPPLASLQDAWNSSYLIYFREGRTAEFGTGFVIRNVRQGGTRTLDLVTAEHVLRRYCQGNRCGNYSIFTDGDIKFDPTTGRQTHQTVPLSSPDLKILARDEATDLALIRITVEAGVDPRPLVIGRDSSRPGDDVWAIGYPNVFLRQSQAGVEDPDHMLRRWSYGSTMGPVSMDANNDPHYDPNAKTRQAHSADSLPGNSGGPLLNARGEVVGVLAMSGSVKANQFNYAKRSNEINVPSVGVELQVVRAFLKNAYQPRVARAE